MQYIYLVDMNEYEHINKIESLRNELYNYRFKLI